MVILRKFKKKFVVPTLYFLAFLIMVIAFGFAFFIINFGNEGEQFQNPGKSLLKIFVMVLGEFEFDNLYDQTDSSSTITLVFTMLLLIGKQHGLINYTDTKAFPG